MAFDETSEICETVCSGTTLCNWANYNNPFDHQFPDGTLQTCVGAQVRCGCTLTMSLVSYVTYEHPSAVVVSFIFFSTLLLVMLLRCCVTEKIPRKCRTNRGKVHNVGLSSTRTPDAFPVSVPEAERDNSHHRHNPPPQISYIEKEKPPSYTCVMMQEIDCLPPSYVECMKSSNY